MMEFGQMNRSEAFHRNRDRRTVSIFRVLVRAALGVAIAVIPHVISAQAQTSRYVTAVGGSDSGGSNDCTNPGQPCATIQNAVDHSGVGDLILLGPGTYFENVSIAGPTLTQKDQLTFQGDLITGSTVNGNGAGPVFGVGGGHTATFRNLTITNGNSLDATGAAGGGIITGGGTTITVIGCTLSGNKATSFSISTGGAIYNSSGGTLTIINSTISGNSADLGGGIHNDATLNLINCTVSGNVSSDSSGGGIINSAIGQLNLTNTIIAGSTGGDCVNSGTIVTNDHNLIQDGSCSPLLSGDPKLGPLQNNGGPTFTQALGPGSPAIDSGDDAVLGNPLNLTTDQRGAGFPRKSCVHVDIGAYESGAGAPPMVLCPGNITAVTNPGQTTATVSFSATATDQCDGPLSPIYKIGNTVISSPYNFPVGATTVNVSATDSGGLTGSCSFTVTVTLLNICIQDNRSGDTLRFNSTTGQYVYTRCKDKLTLTGTGSVTTGGGLITLTDNRADRRISAGYNPGTLTGRANVTLILAKGVFQAITLNKTNPFASCTCP